MCLRFKSEISHCSFHSYKHQVWNKRLLCTFQLPSALWIFLVLLMVGQDCVTNSHSLKASYPISNTFLKYIWWWRHIWGGPFAGLSSSSRCISPFPVLCSINFHSICLPGLWLLATQGYHHILSRFSLLKWHPRNFENCILKDHRAQNFSAFWGSMYFVD